MTRDFLLSGTVILDQPLAYSPPDCKSAKNVSLFPRQPVFSNGSLSHRPYVGSGAIRGPLRRAAADVLYEKIGVPVSFPTALEWRIGGAKASGEVNFTPEQRAQIKRDNVILAVFGAGSSLVGFLDGSLSIDMMIPPIDIEPAVIHAVRRAEEKTESLLNMLSPDAYQQVTAWGAINTARSRAKARADEVTGQAMRLKSRGPKDADYRAAEVQAKTAKDALVAIEAEAQALGGDVSIGMPLPGYEVLPKGLTFPMEMRLTTVTDVQAGLFFAGLERFAASPFIGAHRAHGCGKISGSFDVKMRQGFNRYQPFSSFIFNESEGFGGMPELRTLINRFYDADIPFSHVRGAA